MSDKKPIIATWGDGDSVPSDITSFVMHRNRELYRPPECGTCGTRSWRIRSLNGMPWELQCWYGHEWVRTADTVIVNFPANDTQEGT